MTEGSTWKKVAAVAGLGAALGLPPAAFEAGRYFGHKDKRPVPAQVDPRLEEGRLAPVAVDSGSPAVAPELPPGLQAIAGQDQDIEKERKEYVDKIMKKNQPIVDEWARRFPAFKIRFFNVYDRNGNAQYEVDYHDRFRNKPAADINFFHIFADGMVQVATVKSYSRHEWKGGLPYIAVNTTNTGKISLEQAEVELKKIDIVYDAEAAYFSGFMSENDFVNVLKSQGLNEVPEQKSNGDE